jgi:YidC/Oxa1 family membrane protein insertase
VQDETGAVEHSDSAAVDETAKGSEITDDAPTTNGSKNASTQGAAPNRAPRRTNNRPKKRRP